MSSTRAASLATYRSRQIPSLLVNALLFVLLVAVLFRYPNHASFGLDPSWAMALGQFFHDGRQFGPEVTFTFGPLGFLYSNTYSGLQFWGFILWQLFSAVVFTSIIIDSAQGLTYIRRFIYFGFFLLLGNAITDAMHQMIITMVGLKLINHRGETWRPSTVLLMLYLALLASIKFTNLLLAAFAVVIVCMQELLRGRWHSALVFAVCFLGGFLALWMACGQSLYNIPMYLHNSWHISQGYQQAMGLPTPGQLLWIGLTVIAVLLVYSLLYLIGHCGTSGTLSRVALLAAFLYLAWKHGFVRSDEHLYIFFVSALLPIVAFPALLDDVSHRRWPSQLLLALAGVMCIWGVHSTGRQFGSEILWYKPSRFTDQLRQHYNVLTQWTAFRASYERHLEKEKKRYNLPHTREVIGQASIDVLGHEQAIALYNGFTYRPRPVFQSYSAYTQHLARLNDDFYHSSQAPAYALLQLHAIDNRFPPLDDSLLLRSFIYRYDYVHTERGFQLWQRRSQPLQEDRDTPDFLRRETIKLNQPLELGELTHKRLWATLSLQPSLLGRLRSTLYKPPIVQLKIEDTQGRRSTFRLPLSQAATGFILNPLIEHSADYVCFMMGIARRQVHALTLEVPKKYVPYFHETARLELSELPFAHSGGACHELAVQAYFWMFQSYPITYETPYVPQNVRIDDRDAVMLHAPSTMEFAMPDGATSISGAFGFVEGAYTGHGKTEGATFRILWQKGQQHVELYRRRLEPSTVPGDRGLQDFRVHLQGVTGGSLVLQTDPGANNSWDWTVWTAIKID